MTALGRLAAVLLVLGLAISPAAAIVGPAEDGSSLAPFVIMVLQRAGVVAGFCSGVVVAPDAVLTAAHCVPAGAAVKVHYRDGDTPVLLPVAAVVRNPGYRADAIASRTRSIDLALVRLAAPLPDRFHAAVLAPANSATVGTAFRIAGFGLAREGDAASGGVLRMVSLAARAPLSDVLLWAEGPAGAGACTGDSGGPVLDGANRVVGVLAWSAGSGRAQCGALTQAIWIGPQRAWIDGVLAGWGRR